MRRSVSLASKGSHRRQHRRILNETASEEIGDKLGGTETRLREGTAPPAEEQGFELDGDFPDGSMRTKAFSNGPTPVPLI
jgi:hypothetical protein